MFLVDGNNLLLLGVRLPLGSQEKRLGDMRKLLSVCRHLALIDESFICYFDRSVPYILDGHDRDLLELLLTEHPRFFKLAAEGKSADEYLIMIAGQQDLRIISHDRYRNSGQRSDNKRTTRWRDHYPWLADPGRLITAELIGRQIGLDDLGPVDWESQSAFDHYGDLEEILADLDNR